MNSVTLREKRAGLIDQARAVLDTGHAREGGPTAEDKVEFDRIMSAAAEIRAQYEDIERLEVEERDLDAPGERRSAPLDGESRGRHGRAEVRTAADYRNTGEYRSVYGDWLKSGQIRYDRIPAEFRDTIIGTDAKGGYLATPTVLANEIVKLVDDLTFIRSLARVYMLGEGKSLGVPKISTRMGDANWTTEVASVTEDTTMAVGRTDLTPAVLSKLAKVSMRSLEAVNNLESTIMEELAYKFAITEEKGYLTGDGSAPNPLGIFTASASGVPTSRDVATGNSATAIVADNLFAVKYSLKAGYRADPTCRWLLSRTAVGAIMLLKDTTNQYLWQPSVQADTPDRLLGIPVAESEYVPATFTTGLYVGALGALRYYWIAEAPTSFAMQRLVELYAGTNEVGFIGRRFLAGAPVLGEAFSRIKLG
jgi:HK97 family phage major capsid protein